MMFYVFIMYLILHILGILTLCELESKEGINLNYKGWLLITLLAPGITIVLLLKILVENVVIVLFKLLSRFQK